MSLRIRLIIAGIVAVGFGGCASAGAPASNPPKQGQRYPPVTRAVFADGRLWLRSTHGEISSIRPGQDSRIAEALPEPAVDLCARNGQPEVLTCPQDNCRVWTLRRRTGSSWSKVMTVETRGDKLMAVSCAPDETILVTTQRLVQVVHADTSEVALSEDVYGRVLATVHATREYVFVGLNSGEWGGGFRRIDRGTGHVSTVERNDTGEGCGGPLNTDCNPVNAIVPAPWKPDCLVAAIGLVHFLPSGRLIEICGDSVRLLLEKPYQADGQMWGEVAFFGLARQGDTLWAAGIDGLYRIEGADQVQRLPLPEIESIGGVGVSFEHDALVLFTTDVNRRASISGFVPMLVPR